MKLVKTNQARHLIIIGGQRCGTTFALEVLKKSSQFITSTKTYPEPKYFLDGESNYSKYCESVFNLYSTDMSKIYVEKSTTYYERPDAIRKIDSTLDRYLLLLLLRNPIEREIGRAHV